MAIGLIDGMPEDEREFACVCYGLPQGIRWLARTDGLERDAPIPPGARRGTCFDHQIRWLGDGCPRCKEAGVEYRAVYETSWCKTPAKANQESFALGGAAH